MSNFIEIKKLIKEYKLKNGGTLRAVDEVDLSIEKGDIYGIMGLSGAGKSTLIRLINRLEESTSGEIKVNGINVLKYNQKDLREFRKKTGMIFQHFNLLNSRNVRGNIAFPLEISGWKKEEIDRRVTELLKIVGLEDRSENYPEQLSGGQKQRVAIARALATNPEILLSDEATSALDPRTTNSILELLKEINKKFGITIILITHQMEVIRRICNKAAIMSDGKVIEKGSTKNIFLNPKNKLTKEFVSNIKHDELEFNGENENYKNNKIIKLKFTGNQVDKPYVYELINIFDVKVNILSGAIDRLSETRVGNMVVEIDCDDEKLNKIVDWLKENNVELEVL